MKNQEISTLIGQKRAYNSSSFLLYISKIIPSGPLSKQDLKVKKARNIAILASKKNFKTAVLRNKVRRMVRNAINKVILELSEKTVDQKAHVKALVGYYNLIFSLKKGFEKLTFADLVEEIRQSLLKNGII